MEMFPTISCQLLSIFNWWSDFCNRNKLESEAIEWRGKCQEEEKEDVRASETITQRQQLNVIICNGEECLTKTYQRLECEVFEKLGHSFS